MYGSTSCADIPTRLHRRLGRAPPPPANYRGAPVAPRSPPASPPARPPPGLAGGRPRALGAAPRRAPSAAAAAAADAPNSPYHEDTPPQRTASGL